MQLSLQRNRIELLRTLYMACQTSPDDIDEAKYTLQKKLSEVSHILFLLPRVLS